MFTTVIVTLILFGLIRVVIFANRGYSANRAWEKAKEERDLMFFKYCELRDDPTMTRTKWLAWLPIFEFADREFEANNCYSLKLKPLAELVRRELQEGDLAAQ